MRQEFVTLDNGTHVAIPELCLKHGVPYKVMNAPATAEEKLCFFDKASLTVAMHRKYDLPIRTLQCWPNNSTAGNRLNGTLTHGRCPDGVEIEIGGYLLGSYCGVAIDISVFVPKVGGTTIDRKVWNPAPDEEPINWESLK